LGCQSEFVHGEVFFVKGAISMSNVFSDAITVRIPNIQEELQMLVLRHIKVEIQ
jgi:hypothetical protein